MSTRGESAPAGEKEPKVRDGVARVCGGEMRTYSFKTGLSYGEGL